ncbi:TPA: BREX-3 system phosphatase PglZ [Vibrio parahaemolyticus]|nr:BREX-3 system phosphatase PglZ [Vibrio parahaemolyticus]HCG8167973.1 BREX-3 system phosphatase PglZ [Vibrio parahaemolyticus]HCG9587701.1 BREX-3 system phosphatase PglZ [Vibrio parahaemolyticus]
MKMRWHESLLNKLAMNERLIFIIHDPFGLCFEPVIAKEISESGASFWDANDPIALRLLFEEWSEGVAQRALIIRISDKDSYLPFDIVQKAKMVDFHIGQLIPSLDTEVLSQIESKHYQYLIDVTEMYRVGKLSQLDSLDFVLRHIFKIAPEVIQTDVDLVRLLIRRHYLGIEMPSVVEARLIRLLGMKPQFDKEWDFSKLIPHRAEFFAFLQSQWLLYLDTQVIHNKVRETGGTYPSTRLIIPFDDQDIRVFVDNLFAEGLLKAVEIEGLPTEHWAWVGVISNSEHSDLIRFEHLLSKLEATTKILNSDIFSELFWGGLSQELGTLNASSYLLSDKIDGVHRERLSRVNTELNTRFESWLLENFGRLINMPSINQPNMLHKVPAWINRRVQHGEKVCLLVMDGMGFQQWARIKACLSEISYIQMEESYSFAWVPTITSISRQALFSGKRPQLFPDSLLDTNKEEALWRAFWEDQGLMRNQVLFKKTVEKYAAIEDFEDLFHSPSLKVIGFVINFIDDQMHGMKAGMSGLSAVLDDWLKTWSYAQKINRLLEFDFTVIVTADHGNQEAIGQGWEHEGVKAETKGERVRLYRQPVDYSSENANVLEWPAKKFGLPSDIYPLVSRGQHAFIQKGKKVVGHGGVSLHEVVVPFVTIARKYHAEESKF